jgi:hypothetical protein
MKLFKIRHKPSGLFYLPNKQVYKRENLDAYGKVYHLEPSLGRIQDARTRLLNPRGGEQRLLREDFEILVYEAELVDIL